MKIPHKLAHEFSYILDTMEIISIPDELVNIFSSMKLIIEKTKISSKHDKIYASSGSISFFKKIEDKANQTKKHKDSQKIHEQSKKKQDDNSGIDDSILEGGINFLL